MKVVKYARILRPINFLNMRPIHKGQTIRVLDVNIPQYGENAGKRVVTAETSPDPTTSRGFGEIIQILEEFIEYIDEAEDIYNEAKPVAQKIGGFFSRAWLWIKNIFGYSKK